jgi:GT2 family glycosyltransferase
LSINNYKDPKNLDLSICLVTVTYGDRFKYVSQVIEASVKNGVNKIIIVDNASSRNSREALDKFKEKFGEIITVIRLDENKGSAGGFKLGLKYAKNNGCEFVWLLDDDNLPLKNSLSELLIVYNKISSIESSDSFALLSLRKDRDQFLKVAQGYSLGRIFPKKNSFRGFDILQKINNLISNLKNINVEKKEECLNNPIQIPFGPYGGLFFNINLLTKIGLPKEQFFVYSDDHEFTYRITQSGGSLFMVPTSEVADIEQSWTSTESKKRFLPVLLASNSDKHVYYSVRNHAFLDRNVWCDNKLVYSINKYIYLLLLGVVAIVHRDIKRYLLIIKAISIGERFQFNEDGIN